MYSYVGTAMVGEDEEMLFDAEDHESKPDSSLSSDSISAPGASSTIDATMEEGLVMLITDVSLLNNKIFVWKFNVNLIYGLFYFIISVVFNRLSRPGGNERGSQRATENG